MSQEFVIVQKPTRKNFDDLTGKEYERITVHSYAGVAQKSGGRTASVWNGICSCGTMMPAILATSLKTGNTTSCGCYHKDAITKHGHATNGRRTTTFRTHEGMVQRCTNPKDDHWNDYGGRGILIEDRWLGSLGFIHFLEDMGERPPGMTLDRIDVNGPYSKANCRWATPTEQCRNKRNNTRYEYQGKMICLIEIAEIVNMNRYTLKDRLDAGMSVEEAISKPVRFRSPNKRKNELEAFAICKTPDFP